MANSFVYYTDITSIQFCVVYVQIEVTIIRFSQLLLHTYSLDVDTLVMACLDLVHFDNAVNLGHKPETCEEANSSWNEKLQK